MTRLVALALVAACSHPAPPPPDRVLAWREDLQFVAAELPKRHANAFFHVAEADWRRAVDELDHALPSLEDGQVLAGLARLAAMLGDAHTVIGVFGQHGVYPIAFTWFDDGIFVTGADAGWAIGDQLVGIGARSTSEAIAALTPLVSHENDAWLHDQLAGLLRDPALLAGTGLAPADHAVFRLAAKDGTVRELDLRPASHGAAVAPPKLLPLHLQGPSTNYWNKYVAPERLIYFAYNDCADDPHLEPFATFAASTLAFADQHPVDRFVIDLRRNSGGNSRILQPLIDGLSARPALAGRVFAIIGMHTFSSGMINAMDLSRRLHAKLVGGPTGGKPSSYMEIGLMHLPHSKLVVQYSTKHFSNPDFPGDSLQPELPVTVRSDDWFSGRDPAMDAIAAAPVP